MAQTVYVGGICLHIEPFKLPEDRLNVGGAWKLWLEEFEEEAHLQKVQDIQDWIRSLRRYGGPEVRRLAKYLPDPPALPARDGQEAENDYQKLVRKLNIHFIPQENKHHARFCFNKETLRSQESITSYAARLREKAEKCEFGENSDDRILEHICQTISDQDLIKKCISKKWNLSQFLDEAAKKEDISSEVKDMKNQLKVMKISDKQQSQHDNRRNNFDNRRGNFDNRRGRSRHRNRGFSRFRSSHSQGRQQNFDRSPSRGKTSESSDICSYCGQSGGHKSKQDCPAYGKDCTKCGRQNHFASCCQSGRFIPPSYRGRNRYSHSRGRYGNQNRHARAVDSYDENDNNYYESETQHLSDSDNSTNSSFMHNARKIVLTARSKDTSNSTVWVQLNKIDARCEPDSGATANVMDEYQFRALKKRDQTIQLKSTKEGLSALQNKLTVLGEFPIVIRNKNRGVQTKFMVIKGHIDSPPLLSRDTLVELGMLKIDPNGKFKVENDLKIKKLKNDTSVEQNNLEKIINDYHSVFHGIGEIKDPKSGQPIEVRLEMDPNAIPVAQKPRNVPYYLQQPLKEWIDEGEREGIFEKVPANEAITWCSPLVVQPKPKYSNEEKLDSHMIRASIDMRIPNRAMMRSRCVQAPIIEDFTYTLRDCKIFSKLDLRQGYHQLRVSPETAQVATFSTPWGNYRPRRLVFGAKSSQDVFDEAMFRIFGDIPRCMIQRDDLLIGGRNRTEHDKTVAEVLKRAKEYNVTFNKEKCEFATEKIEFFGHRFTSEGLQADPDKIRAVEQCSEPKSKEEVRSLLGMTGYLSNFIPQYSTLTAPLRMLTRNEVKFKWTQIEQKAFEKLKNAITSADTMMYFDPAKPIILRTEASYNEGLSAGLFQPSDKGLRPVHFISRSLTDTEKRYSQTEKDALAIKWATGRLRIYLSGAPRFTIITGHKPLIPMFEKIKQLPPRIEKWIMEIQDLDFTVKYEPGRDEQDPMDYLSRHPLPESENDKTEKVIRQISRSENSTTLEEIRKETATDSTMQEIIQCINKGNWKQQKKNERLKPYFDMQEEFSTVNGLLYRIDRIVIPESLQRKIVKIGHKLGHLGKTKTKQMLREKYWFPAMNSIIDQIIEQCYECKVATKDSKEEPIKPSEIPSKPWDVVAMDFGGPYPDGHYNFVLIDKRTRYPVVEEVPSTAMKHTREKLKHIFATYGTPNVLVSDNGPPFNSHEFEEFATEEGFKHHRITPLHPRANGQAENFMRLLNKTEQISHLQGKDSCKRRANIQDMLIAYRSSPHPATGVSPYKAMQHREIRTKLDYEPPNEEQNPENERMNIKDSNYKQKMKEKGENRNTRKTLLVLGDYVLVKQTKKDKWTTPYEPIVYTVIEIKGSQVTARRITDGRVVCRDASYFKLVNSVINTADDVNQDIEMPAISEITEESPLAVLDQNLAPRQTTGNPKLTKPKLTDPEPEINSNPSGTEENTRENPNEETTPKQVSRPTRNRKPPVRFKDYVTIFN